MKKYIYLLFFFTSLIFFLSGCSNNQDKNRPSQQGGGLGKNLADTSYIKNKQLGISYGSQSKTQTLDIYFPNEQSSQAYPVIILFHGGGFMMGNSRGKDLEGAILSSVQHGYAVVSVNYRLSGEAAFPAAINDAKAAVRWVKAHASEYHFNGDKIAVWGGSAGGNIAAMIGTTAKLPYLGQNDNPENMQYSSAVQAVVDWFGPLDFLSMDKQFEDSGMINRKVPGGAEATSAADSPESKYLGKQITLDPQWTKQADPGSYIHDIEAATAPYFLIQHGTNDNFVPIQQSVNFANALKKKLGEDKVKIILLEGAGHGTPEFNSKENLDKVHEFLSKVLL